MFGRKTVAETRQELGITMQEMADKLGITRQTYSKLESNPEEMSIRDARLICMIFGKKFEDIFFLTMVNPNSTIDSSKSNAGDGEN